MGQTINDLQSVDTIEVVIGLGEGPCKGLWDGSPQNVYFNDTPIENSDGTSDYTTWKQPNVGKFDVRFSNGPTPGDTFAPNVGFSNPINVGQVLRQNLPVTQQGATTQIDWIDVRIRIDSAYHTASDGSIRDIQIVYQITVAPANSADADYWNPLGKAPYPDWYLSALQNSTLPAIAQDVVGGGAAVPPVGSAMTVNFSTYREVYVQATAPTNPIGHVYLGYQNIPLGAVWFDSSNGYAPSLWTGSAWVSAGGTMMVNGHALAGPAAATAYVNLVFGQQISAKIAGVESGAPIDDAANLPATPGDVYWTWSEGDPTVTTVAYLAVPPDVPTANLDALHMWIVPGEATSADTTAPSNVAFLFDGINWTDQLTWDIPAVTDDGAFMITGNTSTTYVKQHHIPVPRIDVPYVVSVVKRNSDYDAKNVVNMAFDSLMEMRNDTLTFDGLMAAHLTVRGSSQFSGQAKFTFDCGGVLVPLPSNYDAVNKIYNGVWDGTWVFGFTDNPAYHIKNIVENTRYGYAYYRPVTMNPFDVYGFGRFCDTYGFTLNLYITEVIDLATLINQIAGIAGGLCADFGDGAMRILWDDWDRSPVAVFAPENVVNGTFQYGFTAIETRKNDITVSYDEPEYRWQESQQRLVGTTTDEGHVARYGRNTESFVAVGCIFEGEAIRRAMLRLLNSTRNTCQVTFQTNRFGLALQPFDQFLVVDPTVTSGLSGRIRRVRADNKSVVLRDAMALPDVPGVQYLARINTSITLPSTPPLAGDTALVIDETALWSATVVNYDPTGVYQVLEFATALPSLSDGVGFGSMDGLADFMITVEAVVIETADTNGGSGGAADGGGGTVGTSGATPSKTFVNGVYADSAGNTFTDRLFFSDLTSGANVDNAGVVSTVYTVDQTPRSIETFFQALNNDKSADWFTTVLAAPDVNFAVPNPGYWNVSGFDAATMTLQFTNDDPVAYGDIVGTFYPHTSVDGSHVNSAAGIGNVALVFSSPSDTATIGQFMNAMGAATLICAADGGFSNEVGTFVTVTGALWGPGAYSVGTIDFGDAGHALYVTALSAPVTTTPTTGTTPSATTATIGFPMTFKVLEISQGEDVDHVSITALQVDKTIGAQLLAMVVDESIYTLGQTGYVAPVSNLVAIPSRASDGTITVSLSWAPSPTTSVTSYRVEVTVDGGAKQLLGSTTNAQNQYTYLKAGSHRLVFYVTAIDASGGSSASKPVNLNTVGAFQALLVPPSNFEIADVTDQYLGTYLATNPRPDPSVPWLEFKSQSPTFTWAASTGANLDHYLVQISDPATPATIVDSYQVAPSSNPSWIYTYALNQQDHGGKAARTFQITLRQVATDGTIGSPTSIVACNPPPPPPVVSATRYGTDLHVSYPLPNATAGTLIPYDANFAAAQVFVSTVATVPPATGALAYQGTAAAGVIGAAGSSTTEVGLANTVIAANRYPAAPFGNQGDLLLCSDLGLAFTQDAGGAWDQLAVLTGTGSIATGAHTLWWDAALGAGPAGAADGDTFFEISTGKAYVHAAGAWGAAIAPSAPPSQSGTLWVSSSAAFAGLPLYAVVGFADSFGDGAVTYSAAVAAS